ncbi:MAG TPA: RNA polymerase Rpb4 family protein [Candidatus Saccharimonadales bacterium]|nr:RNA polymerase Rpb4 family protein [Candidatus Saccharimonadales bacterium]
MNKSFIFYPPQIYLEMIFMSGKNERTTKIATLPEALEILTKREKEGEFGYEQTLALDYAKKFSKADSENVEKIKKQLMELEISEKIAISIINVMPMDVTQMKQILANEKKALEPEVADKAFAIVESNRIKG